MDDINRAILRTLQADGRISNAALAREVGLSPPATLERVRRLEQAGVIRHYVALVDRKQLNHSILAFIAVTLSHHQREHIDQFIAGVSDLPEILECYHLTGDTDYLLKVVVPDIESLQSFILDRLAPIPGVDRLRTSVVFSEIKHETALPIPKPQSPKPNGGKQ